MNRLEKIIHGVGSEIRMHGKPAFRYIFKDIAPPVVCADGTEMSVQGSESHYCTPRTNTGPYTEVEVAYPTVTPPETWARYADGEYPSDVYGRVPIDLVREFVEDHGGCVND